MRLIMAALLLLLHSVAAGDTATRQGFYAGVGVGKSLVELEDGDSPADFKANDPGYKLALGYRFNSWLAGELSYMNFGKAEDQVLADEITAKFDAFTVSAVFLWDLEPIDLFGCVGAAAWDGKVRNRTFGSSANVMLSTQ